MPFAQASRFFLGLAAVASLLILTGCDIAVSNLTPETLPANPSRLHTITLRVETKSSAISSEGVRAVVVVDGQAQAMRRGDPALGIYEYDYQLPSGREGFSYYFLVEYEVTNKGRTQIRERYTELFKSEVVSRYVLSLEASRAPAGARVGILGRGFGPRDLVFIDQTPARTVFDSSNALSFYVPDLPAGRTYQVSVQNETGSTPVGTFRIDAASVSVSPSSLELRRGASAPLSFTLAQPAPEGGLLLDVTTDIADAIIMPEVVIPAGARSVTVPIQGARATSGSLFLPGGTAVQITITE